MGLTLREARRRLDAVLEFAELEDFVDLKLKNYSSGMLVRLAFAIMVQADADIMLIDEVLAVGDAAFGQKCLDVFDERRRAGKTVVLVTHDMAMVQSLCHRGMVIHDGELDAHRRPGGRRPAATYGSTSAAAAAAPRQRRARSQRARDPGRAPRRRRRAGGERRAGRADPSRRRASRRRGISAAPSSSSTCVNEDGVVVVGFSRDLDAPIAAGQRVRLAGRIENRAGRRAATSSTSTSGEDRDERRAWPCRGCGWRASSSTAPQPDDGLVSVQADLEPVLERDVGAAS